MRQCVGTPSARPGRPADVRNERDLTLFWEEGLRQEGKKHTGVLPTTPGGSHFIGLPPFPFSNVSIFKEPEE